jgi:hemerythrin-like domain-containing protein
LKFRLREPAPSSVAAAVAVEGVEVAMSGSQATRRRFLTAAGSAGGLLILRGAAAARTPETNEEEDVSPAEDLMREHGVLKRVLLVYREALRRLDSRSELPPEPIAQAARIIRTFIEDYHEKLEEDHLFPRFRKANRLVDLVEVLLAQHRAGRRLTDTTIRLATKQGLDGPDSRKQLGESLRLFVRMYEPHEAREDTVLFPALHRIVSGHEYDALGEDFEKKEHELFGEDGFEKMVDRVAGIERSLGIYELSQFTPRA